MVGHCTRKEFKYFTVKCKRMFFLSFRKDNGKFDEAICGKRYQLYKNCSFYKFRQCQKDILSVEMLDRITTLLRSAAGQSSMCSIKGSNIPIYGDYLPFIVDCPNHILEDLNDCSKPWYHMFLKDRGDPELCDEYQKHTECAKRVIIGCKVSFPGMEWIFKKDLNPFCDKEQLVSHMTH